MISLAISDALKTRVPELTLSCIECDVLVQEENPDLWGAMDDKVEEVAAVLKVEEISRMPAIASTRRGYRACGKDPARYRPSAEALLRRTVQGKGLFRVNNVVDLLNLVSLSTGFSIGGYDAEKIAGDVTFGIGEENEPYEGIGRGALNIGSLPVFRDSLGAFGSPTSDSSRTSVTNSTRRFLMVIIDFGASQQLQSATEMAVNLLGMYADAERVEVRGV